MRRRDFIPVGLLVGIAAIIVVQARNMGDTPRSESPAHEPSRQEGVPPRPATERADTSAALPADTLPDAEAIEASDSTAASADNDLITTRTSNEPPLLRDVETIRTLIRDGSPGTYLPRMLQEQEQLLVRWPERRMNALRVWIERHPSVSDWNAEYPIVAEHAFQEWQRAGFPLRFEVVRDSANTDIQIRWINSFPKEEGEKLGMARKARDQHGWIIAAAITIATHDTDGRPLPPTTVAGTARHEVGHALGLGHSDGPADVMFPESRTTTISAADRATLHLLYILPPGVVK